MFPPSDPNSVPWRPRGVIYFVYTSQPTSKLVIALTCCQPKPLRLIFSRSKYPQFLQLSSQNRVFYLLLQFKSGIKSSFWNVWSDLSYSSIIQMLHSKTMMNHIKYLIWSSIQLNTFLHSNFVGTSPANKRSLSSKALVGKNGQMRFLCYYRETQDNIGFNNLVVHFPE